MANKKDFATSTVLTAPSPADSGTSLVVQTGHGARFPAAPFYVVAHPPAEFPTLDNAEKLLVSSKSTDTFTITRGEGDTSPLEIEAGWRISNAVFLDDFPDTFDDLTDGSTNKAFTGTEKTKLSGIETAADVTDATNVAAAGAVMESDTSTASMNFVVDEDNMSSNSDTKLPSQQSVKAYVDNKYNLGLVLDDTSGTNPLTHTITTSGVYLVMFDYSTIVTSTAKVMNVKVNGTVHTESVLDADTGEASWSAGTIVVVLVLSASDTVTFTSPSGGSGVRNRKQIFRLV